jgi:hypothetical protein
MSTRESFLLISRGDQVSSVSRARFATLLAEQLERFRTGAVAAAKPAVVPVEVHSRVMDPKTLQKIDGMVDASKRVKQTIHTSAARWVKETVSAVKPVTTAEWASEALREPPGPVFYKVGPWVLRQGGPGENYYINVYGSAGERKEIGSLFHLDTGREVLQPDYAALWRHAQMDGRAAMTGPEAVGRIRQLLTGGGTPDTPASLACLTAAVFLAEARRLPANLLAGPMLLDLVQLKSRPCEEFTESHPTARGGGSTRLMDESKERVTDIAMEWLSALSLPGSLEYTPYGQGGDAAGPAAEGEVATLVQQRAESASDGREAQGWTYHVAEAGGGE